MKTNEDKILPHLTEQVIRLKILQSYKPNFEWVETANSDMVRAEVAPDSLSPILLDTLSKKTASNDCYYWQLLPESSQEIIRKKLMEDNPERFSPRSLTLEGHTAGLTLPGLQLT